MWENTDQENSEYGHFSRSESLFTWANFYVKTPRGSRATKVSPVIMKVDLKKLPLENLPSYAVANSFQANVPLYY